MTAISLNAFSLQFGDRTLFKEVTASISWAVSAGGPVVGLMGPSGSGKSTLMKQILEARYGRGNPTLRVQPSEAVIGFVPQAPVLFAHMDVLSNARLFERAGRYTSRFDSALFDRISVSLGMTHVLRQKSHLTLSGGEAQRLMLLRTLSIRPDILMLDEPAAGLDASVREEFLVDLARLVSDLDISTLYIGHHWDEISFVASRIAYLVTDVTPSGALFVKSIPVEALEEFRQRPPTPEAFLAVYGPGCEVLPVAVSESGYELLGADVQTSALIACVPPNPGIQANQLQRTGPFRRRVTAIGVRSPPVLRAAWIYRNGEFHTHAKLAV